MGAEGSFSKTFYVSADVSEIIKWVMENQDAVVKSTHCEVVSRDGDLVRVKRETVKGTFEFTLKEMISVGKGQAVYATKLVESHKGGLVDEQMRVTLTRDRDRTQFKLYAKAKVDRRNIRRFDIIAGLAASAKGFENLMIKRF